MEKVNFSTSKNVTITVLASIFSQVVNVIIALVLPRLLIFTYGSDFNGIVSAARQFSTYLAMIDSGISAATCYQFIRAYKEDDKEKINALFSAVGDFFKKAAYFVIVLTVVLSIGYAFFVKSTVPTFNIVYIFIMYSLGTIVAYFTFFKYNLVLFSDGKQYYIAFACAISSLLTLIGQWFAIQATGNIYIMAAIYPLFIIVRLVVIKHKSIKEHPYLKINKIVDKALINQKWDSLTLNIADNMKTFAPIMCLSFFFGSAYVSIYTTYETVLHFGSSILITCLNGLVPTLGKNLLDNSEEAQKEFRIISLVVFWISGIISLCFACMILSFMHIYIGDSADRSYEYPMLAFAMILNVWFLMIRTSYDLLMKSNGFIRELRKGAVIEIVIAISACLLLSLTNRFELVPVGVIVSTAYRTVRMCLFSSRQMKFSVNHNLEKDMIIISIIATALCIAALVFVPIVYSVIDFIVSCLMVLLVSIIIYSIIIVLYYPKLGSTLFILIKRKLKKQ